MSEQHNLLSVGWYKGEMDFGISGFGELTHDQMKEFRMMLVVAIGQAEMAYARVQESGAKSLTKELS